MTQRLTDVSARIDGIQQLGAVVNAMKGIAAARTHAAVAQVAAVDRYAATLAAAMASVTGAGPDAAARRPEAEAETGPAGLLAFCAEQGFAGAFSERVLDAIGETADPTTLFLIGTRGLSVAASRGIAPGWSAALPSHAPGIPRFADAVASAVFDSVGAGRIDRLDVLFTAWEAGRPTVLRRRLFPLDPAELPPATGPRPLLQLPPGDLIERLGRDLFHAQVCKAALHAFAAENQARMEAMSAAGAQIARELESFRATLRRVRQEAITAEIIELGAGAASPRGAR